MSNEVRINVDERKAPNLGYLLAGLLIAAIIWALNWFLLTNNRILELLGAKDPGTFGDAFGATNALFSGLAFVGVIYAIFVQRHELIYTRDNLIITTNVLLQQQENNKVQNEHIRKQIFESTFFQLLRHLSDITAGIDEIDSNGRITKGKDMFPIFLDEIKGDFASQSTLREDGKKTEKTELMRIVGVYEKFYSGRRPELGHYFRMIYNILKFVERSDLKEAEKRLYSNLLRAQLSDAEIELLAMNSVSKFGNEKMKPLVERYAMLKILNNNFEVTSALARGFDKDAFGNQ